MSLNQLLYADSNVDINNRKWLNIIANNIRFGAKGDGFDQQVLDYYTYDPDAPNVLTLTPTVGTITGGTMTLDVARIGRFVTIQLNTTAPLEISDECTFTAGTISSNARPRVDTRFVIPASWCPNDPASYTGAVGFISGVVKTSGVIEFDAAFFSGEVISGGVATSDAYYMMNRPGLGIVPTDAPYQPIPGTSVVAPNTGLTITGGCISYLHAV